MEAKPLFRYFQEDTELFNSSFRYGVYWVIVDKKNRHGDTVYKVERVVRRKDQVYISKKDKNRVFKPKDTSHEYQVGDVIFFDKGGEGSKDGSKQYELVSSLIREEHKDAPEKKKISIMKKYPRI